MKKNNFRLQWLPKSQGQLLCFSRTVQWDSCLTETCTDVWHPPEQHSKRQLFTHMSKTSGPPWNCQLGLLNTHTQRRLHGDQQTDSWWQPLLQSHHSYMARGSHQRHWHNYKPHLVLLSTLYFREKSSADSSLSRVRYVPEIQSDSQHMEHSPEPSIRTDKPFT